MVDMRKEDTKQVGEKTRDGLVCNNDILQNFFHYDLLWSYEFLHVVSFCLKTVCKCNWWCFIILCIVESSNNDVF
jgi:hypothetical protein